MNLFPEIKSPYFIYAPSYTHISSGVRTLHLLCHALNEAGEKAYLIPDCPDRWASNPFLNTPVIHDYPQHQNFYVKEGIDPIAVYPDIVKGNPFNCKKVIRYLLAPAGAFGGDSIFSETDNIWGALPSIAKKVLRIPVSDPNIFLDRKEERSGTCFYSHKYDRIHGNKLIESITGYSIRLEGSLEHIADLLRKSEMCYVYEMSSIITEAALCGCPVILIRTPYFNKIDPDSMMGNVKWSDGESVKEANDYWFEYSKLLGNFSTNLQEFIKDTQEMA